MKIGVLGVGRLGLCFALNLNESGFDVIGYDKNNHYIDSLLNKTFFSFEPMVNEMLLNNSIKFTNNIKDVKTADVLFLFVDTPSKKNGNFDHSNIETVLSNLKNYKNTIVICSTVMPGFCDSLNDRRIVYNPQFISQGNIIQDQIHPDIILIGHKDKKRLRTLKKIYGKICKNFKNYKVMDHTSAEITKLSLNCYVTAKISFANSIGDLCKQVAQIAIKFFRQFQVILEWVQNVFNMVMDTVGHVFLGTIKLSSILQAVTSIHF